MGQFLASGDLVTSGFANHTLVISAFGQPLLMAAAALALVVVRRRDGLAIFTPALLAQQPHYLVFSLPAITRSRILSIAAMIPIAHAFAVGLIAHAAVTAARARRM